MLGQFLKTATELYIKNRQQGSAAKPTTRPEAQPAQPAGRPAAQPTSRSIEQPVTQPAAKPATKPATQPAAQPDSEALSQAFEQDRQSSRVEQPRSAARSAERSATTQPPARSAPQPTERSTDRGIDRPAAPAESKTAAVDHVHAEANGAKIHTNAEGFMTEIEHKDGSRFTDFKYGVFESGGDKKVLFGFTERTADGKIVCNWERLNKWAENGKNAFDCFAETGGLLSSQPHTNLHFTSDGELIYDTRHSSPPPRVNMLTHKDLGDLNPPKPTAWYERTVVRGDGGLVKFDRDKPGMRLDAEGRPVNASVARPVRQHTTQPVQRRDSTVNGTATERQPAKSAGSARSLMAEAAKVRKGPAVALGEPADSSAPPTEVTTPQLADKSIPEEFKKFPVDHVERETYPEGDLAVGYQNGKEIAMLVSDSLYVKLDATEASKHANESSLPRQGEAGWYKVGDDGKYLKLKYDGMSFNKNTREFVSQLTDSLSKSYKKGEASREIHHAAPDLSEQDRLAKALTIFDHVYETNDPRRRVPVPTWEKERALVETPFARQIRGWVNEARAAHGLRPLAFDPLTAFAAGRAADAQAKSRVMSHYIGPPSWRTPQERAGMVGRQLPVGNIENAAMMGSNALNNYRAWWNSGGHRAAILNPNAQLMGAAEAGGFATMLVTRGAPVDSIAFILSDTGRFCP